MLGDLDLDLDLGVRCFYAKSKHIFQFLFNWCSFASEEEYGRVIGQVQKYHNTLCLSPQILHKHCFYFLLRLFKSQVKIKAMLMQNFGGQTKSIIVFLKVAYGGRFCFNGYSKIWWDTSWHINRYKQINDTLFRQRINAGSATDL